MKAPHLLTGRGGEDAAEAFARDKGWIVLARNWRQGRLELDLVCRDGDQVVFVEVKPRDARGMPRPDEALTPRKQRNLVRAARAWLAAHDAWASPCRFDLVSVTRGDGRGDIWNLEHFSHVIELEARDLMGGSHTAWQPW